MKNLYFQRRTGILFSSLALAGCAILFTPDGGSRQAHAEGGFDREQTMLMNLQKSPGSSGFSIMMSLSKTKEMVRDIDKALAQLEAVDKSFAKSRGKPDSRFLEPAQLKIVQARNTAQQLEEELRSAYLELKKSVQDTLAFDQGKRKK